MKKLMFMLAFAVALGVHAASVQWSIVAKGFNDQAGSGDFTKTVYLLQVNNAEGSNYNNLLAALSGGTLEGGIAGFDASDWSAVVGSATTYSGTRMSRSYGKVDTSTATVSDVGDASYVYLVFDGDYYMLSGAQTGTSYSTSPDDGSPAAFTADDARSWTKYEAAGGGGAPEPTSGLLLLVGGSLLALRRKRA